MILRIIVNTILFAAMLFAGQAYGAKYSFTKGTINGAKQAAKDILNNNGYCRSITQDKLTALMLSIPPWEILGGNATLGSPSPMVLGRGDTWAMYDNNGNQTPRGKENERLYSDNDPDHFRRAHWNPGVGIWQLDDVSSPWNLYNHYQRASTHIGGKLVAEFILTNYCVSDSRLKSRLNGTWFACAGDKCWNTFWNDMYDHANDKLKVNIVNGSDWDGGVQAKNCRLGTGRAFRCYWYNMDNAQGDYAANSDPHGLAAQTPLAAPFLTYTNNQKNLLINTWLINSGVRRNTNSGTQREYHRNATVGRGARRSGGWSHSTTLQVQICNPPGSCSWSAQGIVP